MAIVDLQEMGRLDFLISQNVDNLHIKSGIKPELLAELHGNIARLRCGRCETTYPKPSAPDRCDCGGSLRSSVVDFGDSLPNKDLMESYERSRDCDMFVVVGSSLVVTPAASMPRVALESGAKLVIINQGETPLDSVAHLRFYESSSAILAEAVSRLRAMVGGDPSPGR
jgi:NAD-dependent deacetylase